MTTSVSGNTGTAAVNANSFESLNLEAEIMATQIIRSNLIDASLTDQLSDVKNRNSQIAAKNNEINALRAKGPQLEAKIAQMQELQAILEKGKPGSDGAWHGISYGMGDDGPKSFSMYEDLKKLGCTDPGSAGVRNVDNNHTLDASGATFNTWIAELKTKIQEAKTEIDTSKSQIDTLKSDVDSLNSTQQLAMVRMQSLMNKRNESFDLLSTCLKKFSDANSSLIQKF